MGLNLGTSIVSNVRLGNTTVSKVMLGNTQVWPVAPLIDPDAQAFLTAAGITDPTITSAINTFVINLKSNGLWSKMRAIYPFVGGTSSSHKWNLKDPRDLNTAYRLFFSGGLTHSSLGMTGNGTNGFANTHFSMNDVRTLPSGISYGVSIKSPNVSGTNPVVIGCTYGKTSPGINISLLTIDWFSGNVRYLNLNNISISPPANAQFATATGIGVLFTSRNFVSNDVLYNNPNTNATTTANYAENPILNQLSNTLLLLARGIPGATLFSVQTMEFAFIGDWLDTTEFANFRSAYLTLKTALGR